MVKITSCRHPRTGCSRLVRNCRCSVQHGRNNSISTADVYLLPGLCTHAAQPWKSYPATHCTPNTNTHVNIHPQETPCSQYSAVGLLWTKLQQMLRRILFKAGYRSSAIQRITPCSTALRPDNPVPSTAYKVAGLCGNRQSVPRCRLQQTVRDFCSENVTERGQTHESYPHLEKKTTGESQRPW